MKTGLILEGGGMRGIFTAGVLDYFMENDIKFDNIIGVSAGACHAASYVSHQIGRSYDVSTKYLNDKNYCGLYSYIKTGDIFGAEMLYKTIPEKLDPIDNKTFKSNTMKLQVAVTNAHTGMCEYPYINDLSTDTQYIRASSSLPIVSKVVKIGGKEYFDGGITDSIPLKQSENEGFEKNVVILTQARSYTKSPNKAIALAKIKLRKYPQVVNAMKNRHIMYNETLEYIKKREKEGFVFVIAPPHPLEVARVDKNIEHLRQAYLIGCETAKNCFNQMKNFINA